MSKTLQALQQLGIYRDITEHEDYTSAIVGKSKNMEINIYKQYYNIKVYGANKKCLSKEFSHRDNIVTSIIEMQRLASTYL